MDYKLTPEYIRKQTKRIASHREAQKIKTQAYALGYVHAISFYGILDWLHIPHKEFRRIEVLSNTPITFDIMKDLWLFFNEIKPLQIYSIWLYNGVNDDLTLAGEWE